MNIAAWNIDRQLAWSNFEQQNWRDHMHALARTASDQKLDDETRLRALMEFDSQIWQRRVRPKEQAIGGEPTKVDLARKAHDQRKLLLARAERIAAGSTRVRKVQGHMRTIEATDAFNTTTCPICQRPFRLSVKGQPGKYCSAGCRQQAYRERQSA